MTDDNDTEETSAVAYNGVQLGIMVSALCSGGLSFGDQRHLAALLGWAGIQSALLPGSVITLEAVTLIVWNKAPNAATKTKAFWFSVLAAAVSLSLNVVWGRIHNGYGEVSEALVWYTSAVPNIMLVASLKVGSFLRPPRRKPPTAELPPADLPAEPELPTELPRDLPTENELPPAEKPPLPPTEEEEKPPASDREEKQPPLFPVLTDGELPRRAVLLCLKEIADRKTLNLDDDLSELTGQYLADTYLQPSTKRAWNMAKGEALALWEQDPDWCLDIVGQIRQTA